MSGIRTPSRFPSNCFLIETDHLCPLCRLDSATHTRHPPMAALIMAMTNDVRVGLDILAGPCNAKICRGQVRRNSQRRALRPEIPALNVDDLAAVRAFHLGVDTNPTHACPDLVVAPRTFHIDLEIIRLALCHRSPSPFCTGSAFVGNVLLRLVLIRGLVFFLYCLRGQLRFFLGRLCFVSLTAFVSIIRFHRHSNAPSG